MGAPRALPRAEGTQAVRGAARDAGPRAPPTKARLLPRRLVFPDEAATWNLTSIPAALRIARAEGIDAVVTTSPPGSVHLVGAALKRSLGVPWIADLRDSLLAHQDRRADSLAVRMKGRTVRVVASTVARGPTRSSPPSTRSRRRCARFLRHGRVVTITNGSDFDDFVGLDYVPGDRFRVTHTGAFFGQRDPKPFLRALADSGLADVVARFVGGFRAADREFAESLGLADRIEVIPFVPRRRSLELQRDSEALLLIAPTPAAAGPASSRARSSSTSRRSGRSSPRFRPAAPRRT